MKTAIVTGALAVAALGATAIMPKTAEASQWVGSGWQALGNTDYFQVTGCCGANYGASYTGNSNDVAAQYWVGGGAYQTCYAASLLCLNQDFIIGPVVCATSTGSVSHSDNPSGGQYYQYSSSGYTSVTDYGTCPLFYPGAYQGVWVYQW